MLKLKTICWLWEDNNHLFQCSLSLKKPYSMTHASGHLVASQFSELKMQKYVL